MSYKSSASRSFIKDLVREPLFHFLLAGFLLFLADSIIVKYKDSSRIIIIPKTVKAEAHDLFVSKMIREPSEKEWKQILERWVDNEVLYREGMALGLDKGDQNIRERIIFKALSVTQASLNLPTPSTEQLESWFQTHADRYTQDDRFNFSEAVVVGTPSAEQLNQFARALNGKGKSELESSLRIFKDRPRKNLIEAYGEKFTTELTVLQPGVWSVLYSRSGPQLVYLERIDKGESQKFSDISERVLVDWQQETMAQLTTEAIREMGKKYKVKGWLVSD